MSNVCILINATYYFVEVSIDAGGLVLLYYPVVIVHRWPFQQKEYVALILIRMQTRLFYLWSITQMCCQNVLYALTLVGWADSTLLGSL